jgi:hypothetical protein
MLPDLPGLRVAEEALHALGRSGGPCDVGVDFGDDDDSAVAAVWPFFGPFGAHDITADRSPLAHRVDRGQIRNFRTPRANLESVYGAGPIGSPYLYARDDPPSSCSAPAATTFRETHEGIALMGDPRNDVHLFVNQLQVAFVGLHNRLGDRLRRRGTPEARVFEEARRSATWHYQHVIAHEFAPGLVGARLAEELLQGVAQLYRPAGEPHIPFEFADAAFRYGHSQIRHRYQVNRGFGPCPVFPDLMGFGPVAAEQRVDWLIDADPESFRQLDPGGTPTLDSHVPGRFGLADILVPIPEDRCSQE